MDFIDADFESVVADAVASGSTGEVVLVRALDSVPRSRQVTVVAALGEAEGGLGIPVLRKLVRNRGAGSDARCAALVSLSKRQRAGASDILDVFLDDHDKDVQRYALRCLGCVGDGRAWQKVFNRLQAMLDVPPPELPWALDSRMLSVQSESLAAIVYLGRHLPPGDRGSAVVSLIRSHWDRLYTAEQDWIKLCWPACAPDSGIDERHELDVKSMIKWLSTPLLSPLYDSR